MFLSILTAIPFILFFIGLYIVVATITESILK
jgi:hypothetical protein